VVGTTAGQIGFSSGCSHVFEFAFHPRPTHRLEWLPTHFLPSLTQSRHVEGNNCIQLVSVSGLVGFPVSGFVGFTVSGLVGLPVTGFVGFPVSGLVGFWVTGLVGFPVSGFDGFTGLDSEHHFVHDLA
jgi:hypothetical protein